LHSPILPHFRTRLMGRSEFGVFILQFH
jgi:hypothetical protein